MSRPTDGPPEDAHYWRRPEPSGTEPSSDGRSSGATGDPPAAPPAAGPPGPAYPGPPPTVPPPRDWRPPTVLQPAPPRQLPAQDPVAVDAAEREARTLTLGVGMIAGAVVLVLSCLLCSRLLF
ncbi:MAG TPA: translation initiation factor 2 [Pilimelia sp.]|nr:translation initiation factor 2 [Pilimelia sp.]